MKHNYAQRWTVYELSAIQKRCLFFKVRFFIKQFCTLFAKNGLGYPTTFIESLTTHKRFIFKESYISYGKRQKSCTLIVIWVKCLYLTSPTFNFVGKVKPAFLLQTRKYLAYGIYGRLADNPVPRTDQKHS